MTDKAFSTPEEAGNTPAAAQNAEQKRKRRFNRETFDWTQTFCQALFFVVLVFTFLFRFVTVNGESMTNTLHNADRLIICDVGYTPERGDIVVIHDTEAEKVAADPETGVPVRVSAFEQGPIIKRVIATEGETVLIDYDNWTITVTDTDGNVTVLEEPYVRRDRGDVPLAVPNAAIYPHSVGHLVPHTVAEGCVFVCGDNRANSLDSRYVGDIDARKILGKVLWRVFPFSSFGAPAHYDYN